MGGEPRDIVTKQYNECMKEILPLFGISVVEIPRLEDEGGDVISASLVRKYYQEQDFEAIERLVPYTTLNYLKGK